MNENEQDHLVVDRVEENNACTEDKNRRLRKTIPSNYQRKQAANFFVLTNARQIHFFLVRNTIHLLK